MGGPGSGGRRQGAGRKKKPAHLRVLDGGADRRPRRDAGGGQAAPAPPLDAPCVEPPPGLGPEELEVWREWAPLAHKEHTLVESTRFAFAALCESEADRRQMRARYAGNQRPLVVVSESELSARREHRALLRDIRSSMKDFRIAPFGKEIFEPISGEGDVDDPLTDFLRRRDRFGVLDKPSE